jgi:signal peptidase I
MLQTMAIETYKFLKTLAVAAFLAFFCIRGFIVEPFKIPSSSMVDTLLVGDFLLVTKFAYGNRLPLTNWFFWQRNPERGDVIVFKRKDTGLPGSFFGLGDTLLIKRLVGLPGDKIRYDGPTKTLFINGKALQQTDPQPYALTLPDGQVVISTKKQEHLPEGGHHDIIVMPGEGDSVAETTVPPDMFVMMGDNRDNSRDSRYWNVPGWGYVPREDLMGRAEFIFWSWDKNWKPRLERIGNNLRYHAND